MTAIINPHHTLPKRSAEGVFDGEHFRHMPKRAGAFSALPVSGDGHCSDVELDSCYALQPFGHSDTSLILNCGSLLKARGLVNIDVMLKLYANLNQNSSLVHR